MGLQAHTWGGVPRPTPGGVSRPRPRGSLQVQTRGCVPVCTEADPPSWQLLLRAVRILLEYILVYLLFAIVFYNNQCPCEQKPCFVHLGHWVQFKMYQFLYKDFCFHNFSDISFNICKLHQSHTLARWLLCPRLFVPLLWVVIVSRSLFCLPLFLLFL